MRSPGAPTTSLFLQALGLVGATLVAVLVASTIVIINMPPPAPEIYTVAEVAQVLRTGRTADTVEGRALVVRLANGPPEPEAQPGRRHAGFHLALAQALHLSPNDVIVAPGPPHLMMVFGGPPPHPRHAPPPQASPDQNIFGAFVAAVRRPDGRWLTVAPRGQLLDPGNCASCWC